MTAVHRMTTTHRIAATREIPGRDRREKNFRL
jgi:hypothetical protein